MRTERTTQSPATTRPMPSRASGPKSMPVRARLPDETLPPDPGIVVPVGVVPVGVVEVDVAGTGVTLMVTVPSTNARAARAFDAPDLVRALAWSALPDPSLKT